MTNTEHINKTEEEEASQIWLGMKMKYNLKSTKGNAVHREDIVWFMFSVYIIIFMSYNDLFWILQDSTCVGGLVIVLSNSDSTIVQDSLEVCS